MLFLYGNVLLLVLLEQILSIAVSAIAFDPRAQGPFNLFACVNRMKDGSAPKPEAAAPAPAPASSDPFSFDLTPAPAAASAYVIARYCLLLMRAIYARCPNDKAHVMHCITCLQE